MKKFLILQLRSDDTISDNEFETILKFGELSLDEVERIRVEKNGIPDLDLSDYSAVIVGGSPYDISQSEEEKSDMQKKIERDFRKLFDQIVKKDFPFLGACSGNGLLGHYCGANISTKHGEPVGGVDIYLTKEGERDPLLKGLPKRFRALAGHKEACDTKPPKTTLLAGSDTCPVQMFRLKKNIYATQFHPEADAEAFVLRINTYKYNGYFPPEEAGDLIKAVEKEDTPVPKEILRRFVERFKTS